MKIDNANEQLRVLIDYDWTLFNTTAFSQDLWQELAQHAGMSHEEVEAASADFHADPVLGGYKFDDHTAAYGLDAELMWTKLDELLKNKDYLYPDSPEFIQSLRAEGYNPRILSFGEERFQRAKIIPSLKRLVGIDGRTLDNENGLGFGIVFRKKGEHIAEAYSGERGVLVDDVPNQMLPEGFVEIHLERSRNLPAPLEKSGGFVVSSLTQALHVIRTL